ncbi:MAG TPA: ABC transporter ATP-binding protein [Dongiaceae bacterium]|nr:ABC transporter ATP-binding protein [Dongiaceae bacterium]
MLLFEAANAGCAIMIPYALSKIIKGATAAQAQAEALFTALHQPLLLFVLLSIGEVLCGRVAGGIQIRVGPRQRQNVTRQLYHYLQHHSHQYFSANFAGALAHRISETATGVTQTLWSIITEFWPIAIVLVVSICLLWTAHPQLAGFVAVWAFLFILISWVMAKRCQPYAHGAAAARSETTGKIVDSVTNLASARLFARFEHERNLLAEVQVRELAAIRLSTNYAERVRWFQFTAAALLKIGLLFFSIRLWSEGKIGVAEFVMAVSLALMIINEARNLSRRFLEFFEYVGNVANGVNTIVCPHDIVDSPNAVAPSLERGTVEFRQVRFGYNVQQPVFDNLNLVIPAGQRVGLVGFSGSGKSTFASLILRLYDVQQGQVLIDGVDIRDFTQDALHEQLSLIPQDPTLFHRSLKDNIRYGLLEATDDEVEAAARQAHADDFIRQLPEGYDSLVGERGVKLSGGQRQRIAIARVILKGAPILILDEATSSMDSIKEKANQSTLENVMKGRTVLVVAHRLSTISHLDRILVFDDGCIVEDGSHAELLDRRGAYYQLWSRQSDGFLPESREGKEGIAASALSDDGPGLNKSVAAENLLEELPETGDDALPPRLPNVGQN